MTTATWKKLISLCSIALLSVALTVDQASADVQDVRVENKSSRTIWVTIASQKPVVRQLSESASKESSSNTSFNASQKGSLDVAGLVGVSSENALGVSHSQSEKETSQKSQNLDWSPFIDAGEAVLASGESSNFAVTDDVYYLTIRRTKDSFWRMNVPKQTKSATLLTVTDDGLWDPTGEVIETGDEVTMSLEDDPGIGLTRPMDAYSLKHIANAGPSAVTHIIETVDGREGPVQNEDIVRIKIKSPKHDNMFWLHHGAQDNLYYTEWPEDHASHWYLQMVDRNQGNMLVSGMKIQLIGRKWDRLMTVVDDGTYKWIKGMPPQSGPNIWTINIDVEPAPWPK